jgi:hypothetical protein
MLRKPTSYATIVRNRMDLIPEKMNQTTKINRPYFIDTQSTRNRLCQFRMHVVTRHSSCSFCFSVVECMPGNTVDVHERDNWLENHSTNNSTLSKLPQIRVITDTESPEDAHDIDRMFPSAKTIRPPEQQEKLKRQASTKIAPGRTWELTIDQIEI